MSPEEKKHRGEEAPRSTGDKDGVSPDESASGEKAGLIDDVANEANDSAKEAQDSAEAEREDVAEEAEGAAEEAKHAAEEAKHAAPAEEAKHAAEEAKHAAPVEEAKLAAPVEEAKLAAKAADPEGDAQEAEPDAFIGRVMDGRYAIEAVLGEGGIGRVYRATHVKLGRPVALKVLLDATAGIDAQVRTEGLLRFEREAQTLSALNHPNIVTITDFGVDEVPFLVMELALGQDLESVIDGEGLQPGRALAVFSQLLGSLSYAHDHGIVHRDLKPANMLLRSLPDGSDHLEVLDFGLAKFMSGEEAPKPGNSVTRVGMIVGTPAYMAPEQIDGRAADARTDLYSAAVLLFEMLTKKLPFQAETPHEMIRLHIAAAPASLTSTLERPMPAVAEAFFSRAFQKRPKDRFQTANEMLAALDELTPEMFDAASARGGSYSRAPTAIVGGADFQGVDTSVAATHDRDLQAIESVARAPTALVQGSVRAALRRWPPDFSVLARAAQQQLQWALEPSRRMVSLGVAAACVALPFVLVLALGGGELQGKSAVTVPLAESPEVELDDAPERPIEGDIWEAAVPAELRPLRARLDAGRRLGRRQIGTLRAFHSDHPTDARPLILIGRAYVAKGWLSHALPYYLRALATSPMAGTDAELRADLIRMASVEGLENEAGKAIERTWGRAALPDAQQALAEESRAQKQARYRALIERLSAIDE